MTGDKCKIVKWCENSEITAKIVYLVYNYSLLFSSIKSTEIFQQIEMPCRLHILCEEQNTLLS